MQALHWPHVPKPHFDLSKLNHKRLLAVLTALAVVVVMLVVSASSSRSTAPDSSGSGGGQAMPAVADPAPPPDKETGVVLASPSASPTPASQATRATTTPSPEATRAPLTAKPPQTKTAPPPDKKTRETNKKALGIVDYWWDTFVLAMKETEGIKPSAAQLKKPPVVIVDKASCTQPKSNLLGPKSRTSLTYCNGKLELVPKVFVTITEMGQLRVVASGFLYHARAVAPGSQRHGKSADELLGGLQAYLAIALLDYQTTSAYEDAWAVIHPEHSGGEDVDWGYAAAMERSGR